MPIPVKTRLGKVPPSAQSPAPGAHNHISNPLISDAKLRQLFATMLQCRLLNDRKAKSRRPANEAAPRSVGEATVVGTIVDLRPGDWLAPFETDLLAEFVRGLPLASILAPPPRSVKRTRRSWADAPPPGEGPEASHILPRVGDPGTQLRLASGVALALRAHKNGSVIVGFFGDTAQLGSDWREALTLAGKHCLPLVAVVQSTGSSTRASGSPFPNLLGEGLPCEIPVIPVDAEDVVAIYRVAHESIHKARHGGGPTLIQAVSFPAPGGRKAARSAADGPPDAVTRMEEYLAAKKLFSGPWKQKVIDDFARQVELAAVKTRKPSLRAR